MTFWSWLKARFTPPSKVTVTPPPPNATVIACVNRSTMISDARMQEIADALQVQVTRDFAPAWCPGKAYAIKCFAKGAALPAGAWQLVFLDTSDIAGDAGYHETTPAGLPLGKVFCADEVRYGMSIPAVASHELLEMIGDPSANITITGPNGWQYALETADPVEDESFGYTINGVQVSNFVLPAYFHQGAAGPYDFKGYVKAPFQIMRGGYQSFFDGNQWTQKRGERVDPAKMTRREACDARGLYAGRCWKRKLSRSKWRRSEPHTEVA